MQGYYSLIQYSEFPERFEFVNIGVALFAEASPRVLMKFSGSPRRAEQAFGVHLGKHFQLLKQSMEDRIASEFSNFWNKDQIDRFVSMRSGKIRLSPPKSVLVKDPKELIEELFDRLVGGINRRPREQRAQAKLKKQLELHEVEVMLEKKPKPISLPQGVTVKASYAYQNGSYNLINAISLRDDPDQALKNAGAQAAEGKWLFEESLHCDNKKKLIVVGDLEGQQHNFRVAVHQLMEENNVGFYPLAQMEPLVSDIRENFMANEKPSKPLVQKLSL